VLCRSKSPPKLGELVCSWICKHGLGNGTMSYARSIDGLLAPCCAPRWGSRTLSRRRSQRRRSKGLRSAGRLLLHGGS
jgi:hypothetical protein